MTTTGMVNRIAAMTCRCRAWAPPTTRFDVRGANY